MRDMQQNAGSKGYGIILSSLNAGTATGGSRPLGCWPRDSGSGGQDQPRLGKGRIVGAEYLESLSG